MGEHMNLMGAEDVRRAGNMMSSAADEMKRAATQMDESLYRHQQWADEWLNRLEEILSRKKED